MKITEVNITPIAISDPPLLNASGLHAPYALRTIVELITDSKVSGISEIPGGEKITIALGACRDFIIGKDPFNTTIILNGIKDHFGPENAFERGEQSWDQRCLGHILSAVEVACFDIIGKETNRPIASLLGGIVRQRVPFAAYLFFKHKGAGGELGFDITDNETGWPAVRQKQCIEVKDVLEQAVAMCQEFGFKSIKLKGGVFPPEMEVQALIELKSLFGDSVPLRFDPNGVWSVETAMKWSRQLEEVLEYLEDPVRGQESMAKLKSEISIPLATNMCTTSFEDIPSSIKFDSEDIILCDHHFWGGLRASMEISRICKTFGRRLSMHSNSHLGISLLAMTHLGAALPELPYALDTHYPWQSEEVIVGGRIAFEDGHVVVPREPGLGAELDRVALNKLHLNYKLCGLTCRDDEIEMQRVEPDWKFEAVRW